MATTRSEVVNVHDAKTNLSKLLERVAAGEEIVIGKAGKPVAKLVRYEGERRKRVPGALKGQIWMADDFDELPPELLAAFYGEDVDEDRPDFK